MKKLIYLILTSLVAIGISCRDEDEIRVPDFIDAANVRIQIDPENSYFDFQDIDNAFLEYSIYSENENINTIQIFFEYANVAAGDTTAPAVIKTYTQDSFTDGVLLDQRITAAELAAAVGLTTQDLNGGDQFLFTNVTTLTDGRVYPSATILGYQSVPADIRLASATASFTTVFDAIVGCPVSAPFAGEYLVEQISGPDDPFNGDDAVFSSMIVDVEETNPIGRIFEVGYFEGASFDFTTEVAFTLLCGEIVVGTTDTGIGCGGPRFTYVSTGSSPYDDADDSVIIINLLQNTTGACGVTANEPVTLRLTKQ